MNLFSATGPFILQIKYATESFVIFFSKEVIMSLFWSN